MKKVEFYTLGCKVNQYESEALEEIFIKNGYKLTKEDEIADVYVINTCTVTNLSTRKSRQMIRRKKKENPKAIIAVLGCYAQVFHEDLEALDEVDVIIGTEDKNRIVELVESVNGDEKVNIVSKLEKDILYEPLQITNYQDMTRAFIKIQDGCNMYCSYCIIPYARGPIRSRNFNEIIDEVKDLVKKGFKEIVLTGIHIASYGKDLNKTNYLIELIEKLNEIDELERIRFSSLEPRLVTEEFLERLNKCEKVCDHFHLSLQSGSDEILKKMNRKYDTSEYKNIVDNIRNFYPEAGITTDIIVGFPTETDENFKETLETVKDIKFSQIHVFKYSIRDGTIAAKMAQVDGNIKNDRSDILINLEEELKLEFLDKYIDTELDVLFEERSQDEKYMEGYSTNYIRVKIPFNEDLIGKIKKVKIKAREEDKLIGTLI